MNLRVCLATGLPTPRLTDSPSALFSSAFTYLLSTVETFCLSAWIYSSVSLFIQLLFSVQPWAAFQECTTRGSGVLDRLLSNPYLPALHKPNAYVRTLTPNTHLHTVTYTKADTYAQLHSPTLSTPTHTHLRTSTH